MKRQIRCCPGVLAVALAAACSSASTIPSGQLPSATCPGRVAVTAEVAAAVGLTGIREYLLEQDWTSVDPTLEILAVGTEPELKNARQVQLSLLKRYPPSLRNAGIGGTTVLRVLIAPSGRISHTAVVKGSGHEQIDRTAKESAREMRFAPWLRDGCPIPVLADIPVVLSAQ